MLAARALSGSVWDATIPDGGDVLAARSSA
jgi:hypothetical protein